MTDRERLDLSRLYPQAVQPTRVPQVLAMLDETAAYLRARGITGQWPASFTDPLPTDVEKDRPGELRKYAEASQLWMFHNGPGGDPVSTVVCTHWPDLDFAHYWPCGHSGLFNARYICRMAVRPVYRGNGVGAAMMDFAGWLARLAGVEYLRLDCSKTNTRLHEHYRSLGFEHVATADCDWRLSGALFEKYIGLRARLGAVNW